MTNGEKFMDMFGFGADGSRVIAVNSTWWDCDLIIRKPKTNADQIRSMTDEELAETLDLLTRTRPDTKDDKQNWLDWLKQEVK